MDRTEYNRLISKAAGAINIAQDMTGRPVKSIILDVLRGVLDLTDDEMIRPIIKAVEVEQS